MASTAALNFQRGSGHLLVIRVARTGKPYCHCDPCGIQLFFRRQSGISRLRRIVDSELLIGAPLSKANTAIYLFHRLQELKAKKRGLENKRGILFRNEDLDNAIAAVQAEIESAQSELKKLKKKSE